VAKEEKEDSQADDGGGGGGVFGERIEGLFEHGIDVGDFGKGFENLLFVEARLVLALLDHLIVLLHQGSTKPCFLVLVLLSHCFYTLLLLLVPVSLFCFSLSASAM